MWTIRATALEDCLHVTVSRWNREGVYPVELTSMYLELVPGEGELRMLQRVAELTHEKLQERRMNPF